MAFFIPRNGLDVLFSPEIAPNHAYSKAGQDGVSFEHDCQLEEPHYL